jgi:hypothetical protein
LAFTSLVSFLFPFFSRFFFSLDYFFYLNIIFLFCLPKFKTILISSTINKYIYIYVQVDNIHEKQTTGSNNTSNNFYFRELLQVLELSLETEILDQSITPPLLASVIHLLQQQPPLLAASSSTTVVDTTVRFLSLSFMFFLWRNTFVGDCTHFQNCFVFVSCWDFYSF